MLILNDDSRDIKSILSKVQSIEIFKNGKTKKFQLKEQAFDSTLSAIISKFEGALIQPAFGVSLDNETREELKRGEWIKLNFNSTLTLNELPFEALLFRLENECYGLNLIREHQGKLNGRCIYLSFDNAINLSEILKNL